MRLLRRPLYFIVAAVLAAVALVSAPAAATSLAPTASANPIGSCGQGVQTYRMTGPINAWGVRVSGVDLTRQLGIRTGVLQLAIDQPQTGQIFKARMIPFDEFNPPSDFTTVSGQTVRVSVYVEPRDPANGRSCNYLYNAPYPGP